MRTGGGLSKGQKLKKGGRYSSNPTNPKKKLQQPSPAFQKRKGWREVGTSVTRFGGDFRIVIRQEREEGR